MKRLSFVLSLASLIVAAPALAAPAAQTGVAIEAATVKPVPDNAMRLSLLLNRTDKTLDDRMKGFETGIAAALKNNPKDAAVYAQNPGLLDAVMAAGRPVMREHLLKKIPASQRVFAEFYADKFSSAEIDQLIAFYSTPTGRKVISAMYAGVDLSKLSQNAGKTERPEVSAKDVQSIAESAAANLDDQFDSDDWRELFMFSATPVHAKLVSIAPEFSQLVAKLNNEPNPVLDEDLHAAIKRAVTAYRATHGRAHAS